MVSSEALIKKEPLLADGALGTYLIARGFLAAGEAPEVLNISSPSTVQAVHRAYLEAGSQIILTNTFGANRLRLERLGLVEKRVLLNQTAAHFARQTADEFGALVAGDLGPSGRILEPVGDLPPEELTAAYLEQARILIDHGVDFLLLETFSSVKEAAFLVNSLKEEFDQPLVLSLAFFLTPKGPRTLMGETPVAVAETFNGKVDLLGTNCGAGVQEAGLVLEEMRPHTNLPFWLKPNAGLPSLRAGQAFFPLSPTEMAEQIKPMMGLGVKVVGGCCGTTPEHIAALRKMLADLPTDS